MTNGYGISGAGMERANFLAMFPEVLKRSTPIWTLAQLMAIELEVMAGNTDLDIIYANIDSLPEAVLDVLAYDFKADWYDSTYDIDTKRSIIKSCVAVHKKQGTKSGVVLGVTSVVGGAEVEEWFNYSEGKAFHYTIGIPITDTKTVTDTELIERMVDIFVPRRCVRDGDVSAWFSRDDIIIGDSGRYWIYTTPVCGTIPYRTTYGKIDRYIIEVGEDDGYKAYSVPATSGSFMTGTYPSRSTHGIISNDEIDIIPEGSDVAVYETAVCGTIPSRATQGLSQSVDVEVSGDTGDMTYETPATGELVSGTYPTRSTHGVISDDGGLSMGMASTATAYTAKACGSKNTL